MKTVILYFFLNTPAFFEQPIENIGQGQSYRAEPCEVPQKIRTYTDAQMPQIGDTVLINTPVAKVYYFGVVVDIEE